MESKESTFECLDGKINNTARGFATMQKRFKKLERVNNALTHFNKSFGSFLYGLSVNDSSIQWPGAPTPELQHAFRERLKQKTTVQNTLGPVKEVVSEAQPVKSKTIKNKRKLEEQQQPIQKKRRFVVDVDIRKIINGLPLEYRDQTKQMKDMKKLLLFFRKNPNGLTMKSLAEALGLPHHVVTACVNTLLRSKDAVKNSVEGSYATYSLDPKKYPSTSQ